MPNTAPQKIDLGYGIQREAILDDRLIVYSADNATREAIDTWYANVTANMKTYRPGERYAMMHDFSHRNAVLTPYARNLAIEVARLVPKTNMNYAAIIVQKGFTGQAYQVFIRLIGSSAHLQTRIFFSREDGLTWLMRKLSEDQPQK